MYVASNSLPSYTITSSLIQSILPSAIANIDLQGYNSNNRALRHFSKAIASDECRVLQ